ncbi:hypothetical protein [Granulicella arctica]|uniref:hypothetical protein n=1 Tax=Granulicella arctica TaxID=940613 RepID=UPI0021E06145|nr:hypothetical protein [Granulicella arctica]
MVENNKVAAVLKLILELAERATPEELEELRSLELEVLLSPLRQHKVPRATPSQKDRNLDIERTKSALSDAKTRDEAFSMLNREILNKKELEGLARSLDLPVSREDNIDRLTSKIVEATVGSRLNSEAIRNGR